MNNLTIGVMDAATFNTLEYVTWKGSGLYQSPVATTSASTRPITNKDYSNTAAYKPGATRPQKWAYRKSTIGNHTQTTQTTQLTQGNVSRSHVGSSMIAQTIDRPGAYSVKQNTIHPISETNPQSRIDKNAICLVASYYPEPYLTENPLPVSTQPTNCCNIPKFALRMVRGANTNLSKTYYTTTKQYLQNRCQTYEQKAFNFRSPALMSLESHEYIANCYPNTNYQSQQNIVPRAIQFLVEGTIIPANVGTDFLQNAAPDYTIEKLVSFLTSLTPTMLAEAAMDGFQLFVRNPYYYSTVIGPSRNCSTSVYKPNNPQFAVQGGVSSSTLTFKLAVTTAEQSAYKQRKYFF